MPDTAPLHLVWDWNGTVLNDFAIVLSATNASFAEFGLPPITADQYRTQIRLPIRSFYADILGHEPDDAQWEAMDAAFHDHYVSMEKTVQLASGLPDLFGEWAARGNTQSLLSMYHDDKLVPVVEHHGLTPFFALVQGTTPPRPAHKGPHLADHLLRLGVPAERAVLIGDSPDDAHAAQSVGAAAVLYTGGFNDRSKLGAAGVPVADTLADAVRLIDELQRSR